MHRSGLTVTQLLADESFVNYCKGSSAETLYWEKYLSENPQHKETIETAKQMFIDLFNAFADSDLEEQVEKLSTRIDDGQASPVVPMPSLENKNTNWSSVVIKIAAALILIAAGYFAWNTYKPERRHPTLLTYSTQTGEKKTIQLSDGSVVMLNASSQIILGENFGKSERLIKLVGEAFFDVKKNDQLPFIVTTRTLQVKAIGTAFNIKAYPGDAICETALVRGLIQVTMRDTSVMLYPNQKVQWNNTKAVKNKYIINDTAGNADVAKPQPLSTTEEGFVKELAWIENKLIFSDETFADIVPQLERWYGADINFEDEEVAAYRFTATFEKENLQTVLEVLKESKDFNYKIIPGENIAVTVSR